MTSTTKDEPLVLHRQAKLTDPDDPESRKVHSHWDLATGHWPARHWFEDSLLLLLTSSGEARLDDTNDRIVLQLGNATGVYELDETRDEPVNQHGRWGYLNEEDSTVG